MESDVYVQTASATRYSPKAVDLRQLPARERQAGCMFQRQEGEKPLICQVQLSGQPVVLSPPWPPLKPCCPQCLVVSLALKQLPENKRVGFPQVPLLWNHGVSFAFSLE